MNRKNFITLISFLVLGALPLNVALGASPSYCHDSRKERSGPSPLVIKEASELDFKDLLPGTTQAKLFSNETVNGPYGAVTKFAAGTRHGPHTHTYDVKAFVLKGTFIFESDGVVRKLGPGSYISIPGGIVHSSGSGEDEELIFVQLGQHKFDMQYIDQNSEQQQQQMPQTE